MPGRKTLFRRSRKRSGFSSRKRRNQRRRRGAGGQIVHVRKTISLGTFAVTTAPNTYAKAFTFGDFFSNAASLTKSFQMGKLNKLTVKAFPAMNTATLGGTVFPRVISTVDLTDAIAQDFDTLLLHGNHRVHSGGSTWSRTWVPSASYSLGDAPGTGVASTGMVKAPWIEMDHGGSLTTAFLGFKMAGEQSTAPTTAAWACTLYATGDFSFKLPKLL